MRTDVTPRLARTLFVLCCAAIPLISQTTLPSDDNVAKAGNTYISKEEFLSRFELLPGFGRHRAQQLDADKAELVYSMIAEKLLAEEGMSRGLDKDTNYRYASQEVRKMLSRDELYREEVIQKVKVSEKEIMAGISMALREILVSFIYLREKRDADFIRSEIKKPADFESLHIDSSFAYMRDTATIIWGDADTGIERAAYSLQGEEVSDVISAGGGYYILKAKNIQRSNFYGSMQPSVLRERIEEKLRLRKEKVRMEQFVREFLRDKRGYSVTRTLKVLSGELSLMCGEATDTLMTFTPEFVVTVDGKCRLFLRDTLAVVGDDVWTLGEVLEKFAAKGVKVRCGTSLELFRQLNTEMEVLVKQELLSDEALRRGLDRVPSVSKRLNMWRQYYLAAEMKDVVKRSVTVSDVDVYSYLQSKDKDAPVPRVRVRELRTANLDDMEQALKELDRGASLDSVVRRWSVDSSARKNGGVSTLFPITEHEPVGELAWDMDVGQRFGPFALPQGAYYFELLEKKTGWEPGDTAAASRRRDARGELLRMKQRRTLDLFLSQSALERGYQVYEDALKKLDVTPIPMMTFRILGFGGRMFEVPFLEKHIDWINIEPPGKKILP